MHPGFAIGRNPGFLFEDDLRCPKTVAGVVFVFEGFDAPVLD